MPTQDDSQLLKEIHTAMVEMRAKLFDPQTGFVPEAKANISSHNKRITRLEKVATAVTISILLLGWLIANHLLAIGSSTAAHVMVAK